MSPAHGETRCFRDVGRKGIPQAYVPWVRDGQNIDLCPEGELRSRGCDISKCDKEVIVIPKGGEFEYQTWDNWMPYILKEELGLILDDLPECHVVGRDGYCAESPTVARVCRGSCTPSQIREQLKHLRDDMSKEKLQNVFSK